MNKIIWGVSGYSHDASLCVLINNEIKYASSSERYSRIKNDKNLNQEMINDALIYGNPDEIVWYENPFKKTLRNLIVNHRLKTFNIKNILKNFNIESKINYCDHHKAHLFSSALTSKFNLEDTLGVVIDTVGEFLSLSMWKISNQKYKCIYKNYYPNSLGLFYSSITDLVGLKAQEDEYILMGMSSFGNSDKYYNFFKKNFFYKNDLIVDLKRVCKNLFTQKEIEENKFEIAFGAQKIFEEIVVNLIQSQLTKFKYKNLILSGGCALNCKMNTKLINYFEKIWIFPNPGDSGASIGAALSIYNKRIDFKNMFLGHDLKENNNIDKIVSILKTDGVVGVLNGKAEFGPRALGNRSILADPRIKNIKEIVNNIKGREAFRPFAPCVLENRANDYFYMNDNIDYRFMQFLCDTKDNNLDGIKHIDGTSRIQTVGEDNEFLFKILKKWEMETDCPILLNTSLNKKGYPLLNSLKDIKEFKDTSLKIICP